MADQDSSSLVSGPTTRVILQQCLSARLQVQPASDDQEAQYVHIERGLIIYLCLLKGATLGIVEKLTKAVLNVRLSQGDDGKMVSILDLPGDVLIIPQATLGGSLKGKLMQYHKNIDKEVGRELYSEFVRLCTETISQNNQSREQEKQVRHGTYGNRQVFRTDTNGPFTHLIEF